MPEIKTTTPPKAAGQGWRFSLYRKIFDHVFRPMTLGRLRIILPEGKVLIYGTGESGIFATIKITNDAFFKKCVLFGDVGFGESYVDGDWETDDITKVIEWMILNIENHPTLMADKSKRSPVNLLKIANNLLTPLRRNSVKGSRKNIRSHYDLGNEFYGLFLDPTMTYSSAYFTEDNLTLEEAQHRKYERLCQQIRLTQTDHLLEIGSGWGGFAIYAAQNFGCRVTTVTVSQKQFEYARKRIRELDLDGRITIELKDYRHIHGQFDKIVSIEMLEAVGHDYYESYFRQCHALLKKDGVLALQVILSPDHRYESFRKNMDWIQKHIFPGSLLPSIQVIQQNISSTGNLCLHDFKDMTKDYARTLRIWRENFSQRTDQVRGMDFPETFIRKWNYYLCYCEAALNMRNISVAQMIFSRPNNLRI